MSKIIEYTTEEAILIGRAGILGGVLSITSAVFPAISIAENGADASNLLSFCISFFAFIPFAAICGIHWERRWSEDKLNLPLARLFVLSVCALGAAMSLFVFLLLFGERQVGIAIIVISVIVAWWQWPRPPKEASDGLNK